MSDDLYNTDGRDGRPYWEQGRASMLRNFVLSQMLRGAGWSALVIILIGVSLYVLYLGSLLLPEESKQAPSPMGALEQPLDTTRMLA